MESTGKERMFFLPGALAKTWAFLDISVFSEGREAGTRDVLATRTTTADSFILLGLAGVMTLVFKLSASNYDFRFSS